MADGSLTILCAAAVEGWEPAPLGPLPSHLTWYLGELRAGRTVILRSIPDDLPAEAVAEIEYVRLAGMRSHVAIPLSVGGGDCHNACFRPFSVHARMA